ncbi:MAG: ABC transporter ATP-binding protein [Myxococcales bacterium FL481]|nr:MAG: ABC transporter ATP-binding protein [Myxococcales bacterium FL481]
MVRAVPAFRSGRRHAGPRPGLSGRSGTPARGHPRPADRVSARARAAASRSATHRRRAPLRRRGSSPPAPLRLHARRGNAHRGRRDRTAVRRPSSVGGRTRRELDLAGHVGRHVRDRSRRILRRVRPPLRSDQPGAQNPSVAHGRLEHPRSRRASIRASAGDRSRGRASDARPADADSLGRRAAAHRHADRRLPRPGRGIPDRTPAGATWVRSRVLGSGGLAARDHQNHRRPGTTRSDPGLGRGHSVSGDPDPCRSHAARHPLRPRAVSRRGGPRHVPPRATGPARSTRPRRLRRSHPRLAAAVASSPRRRRTGPDARRPPPEPGLAPGHRLAVSVIGARARRATFRRARLALELVVTAPLEIVALHKSYGQHPVLEDLSLRVEPGQVVALMGPNGSGKSTLLGCATGTVVPDAGRVTIAGHELASDPIRARAQLRYLPQEVDVPDGLTGHELLAFFADVFGDPAGIPRALTLADLGSRIEHLATTYSVGMRRRLMLAALELGDAALYVLDEPFAGLDADSRERLVRFIEDRAQAGRGVLIAAHDHDLSALGELASRRVDLGTAANST